MKTSKNKTKASLIALSLMLTIAIPLFALPSANAHTPPWAVPTYAYVSCSPNTVGVGQYTLIAMWLDKFPPTAGGAGGQRWQGFKLDITKPDGNNETLGPFTSDQVGTHSITYTPDQVGSYTIVFSWPGEIATNGTGVPSFSGLPYDGDYFEPATSAPATLQVQQDPISGWQEPPLPTDYWTRPLSTANRDWAQLASNWLGGSWFRISGFQEYGQAPNSAHILYAKQIINGGIADESYGGVKYDTTDYENFFPTPIVLSGKIYYNAGTYPNYGYTCVDLKTGEQLWYKNGTDNGLNNPITRGYLGGGSHGPTISQVFPQLSFGQLYHYHSVNGEGIKDQLWITQSGTPQTSTSGGTMWHMLDANTGNWVMSLKNVPSGTSVTDQQGDILLYSYSASTGLFLAWNVSQSIPPAGPTGTAQQEWEPRTGEVIDAVNDTSWTAIGPSGPRSDTPWFADDILPRSGYTMNVTGPKGLPSLSRVLEDENRVPKLLFHSYFYVAEGYEGGSNEQRFEIAVVSIDDHVVPYSPFPNKPGTQNNNLGFGVTLLWDKNFTYPLGGNRTFTLGAVSYDDGVFTIRCKETRQLWGYSLENGTQLWGPTQPEGEWNMFGQTSNVAYGKLFSTGYAGILYCYDIKTGQLLWNYTAPDIGYESPYGNYPLSIGAIADGKVFLYSTEHSPTQPLWRGSYIRAINATDGKEIWKILNFVSSVAVADGCIVAGNHYDNRMYVYGKGPSATTVSAPLTVPSLGSSVIITGTVTDQSPGAKDTAAIADASQEAWMEYLYEQQAKPSNATGVPVSLDTIDPNGNFVHIGTVTSDLTGAYGYKWTPEVPGTCQIIATFAGSNAYGSSYAQTYMGIDEAVPTTSPYPVTAQPPTEMYIIGTGIAIIIAIAIATIVLMLKKRP